MNLALVLITLITSVSGSRSRGAAGAGTPIPSDDVNWILWIGLLIGVISLIIVVELGYRIGRHRGQLPRVRDGRLLYSIRFDGGPAGMAWLRIMSDWGSLLASLKAECPEPFRILLAAGAIGEATLQSGEILGAVEHMLSSIGSPAPVPALYAQLRAVRDLMRCHPYTRFQRIIDTPHSGAARIPMAHLAEPEKCQGFAVIVAEEGQLSQGRAKPV